MPLFLKDSDKDEETFQEVERRYRLTVNDSLLSAQRRLRDLQRKSEKLYKNGFVPNEDCLCKRYVKGCECANCINTAIQRLEDEIKYKKKILTQS